jgi:hypothetical protein
MMPIMKERFLALSASVAVGVVCIFIPEELLRPLLMLASGALAALIVLFITETRG